MNIAHGYPQAEAGPGEGPAAGRNPGCPAQPRFRLRASRRIPPGRIAAATA